MIVSNSSRSVPFFNPFSKTSKLEKTISGLVFELEEGNISEAKFYDQILGLNFASRKKAVNIATELIHGRENLEQRLDNIENDVTSSRRVWETISTVLTPFSYIAPAGTTLFSLLSAGYNPGIAFAHAAGALATRTISSLLIGYGLETSNNVSKTLGNFVQYGMMGGQVALMVATGNFLGAGLMAGGMMLPVIYKKIEEYKQNRAIAEDSRYNPNYTFRDFITTISKGLFTGSLASMALPHQTEINPELGQLAANYSNKLTIGMGIFGAVNGIANYFFNKDNSKSLSKSIALATLTPTALYLMGCLVNSNTPVPPTPTPVPQKVQFTDNSTQGCISLYTMLHSNYPTEQDAALSLREIGNGTVNIEVIPHATPKNGYALMNEPASVTLNELPTTFCIDASNWQNTNSYDLRLEIIISDIADYNKTKTVWAHIENGVFVFENTKAPPETLAPYSQLASFEITPDKTAQNTHTLLQFRVPLKSGIISPMVDRDGTLMPWNTNAEGVKFTESELEFKTGFWPPLIGDIQYVDMKFGISTADKNIVNLDDNSFRLVTNGSSYSFISGNLDLIRDGNFLYYNGSKIGTPNFVPDGKVSLTLDGQSAEFNIDSGSPGIVRFFSYSGPFSLKIEGDEYTTKGAISQYDLLPKSASDIAQNLITDLNTAKNSTILLPAPQITTALYTPTPIATSTSTPLPTNIPGPTNTPDTSYCGDTNYVPVSNWSRDHFKVAIDNIRSQNGLSEDYWQNFTIVHSGLFKWAFDPEDISNNTLDSLYHSWGLGPSADVYYRGGCDLLRPQLISSTLIAP